MNHTHMTMLVLWQLVLVDSILNESFYKKYTLYHQTGRNTLKVQTTNDVISVADADFHLLIPHHLIIGMLGAQVVLMWFLVW